MNQFNFYSLQKLCRCNFQHLRSDILHQGGNAVQASVAAIVQRIAHYRVTHVAAVDANLVRTSRFQLQFQKRCKSKKLFSYKVGAAGLAVLDDSHLQAILGVTPDGGIDSSFQVVGMPPHQGIIGTVQRAGFQLMGQMPMGSIILRHHHKPWCILVQSMDNARA